MCRELSRIAHRGYVEAPSAWIECVFSVDVGPLTHRYPGYEKHRWLVLEEDGKLLFVPKQVWLCLFELVPSETSCRYRTDQRIWTTPVHWEDEICAREMTFSGQEQIIPVLREYFEGFDYSTYEPSA